MIADCEREPTEQVTVDEGGIHLVYEVCAEHASAIAVCAEHASAIRSGATFAEPVNASRGLLGIDEK